MTFYLTYPVPRAMNSVIISTVKEVPHGNAREDQIAMIHLPHPGRNAAARIAWGGYHRSNLLPASHYLKTPFRACWIIIRKGPERVSCTQRRSRRRQACAHNQHNHDRPSRSLGLLGDLVPGRCLPAQIFLNGGEDGKFMVEWPKAKIR